MKDGIYFVKGILRETKKHYYRSYPFGLWFSPLFFEIREAKQLKGVESSPSYPKMRFIEGYTWNIKKTLKLTLHRIKEKITTFKFRAIRWIFNVIFYIILFLVLLIFLMQGMDTLKKFFEMINLNLSSFLTNLLSSPSS